MMRTIPSWWIIPAALSLAACGDSDPQNPDAGTAQDGGTTSDGGSTADAGGTADLGATNDSGMVIVEGNFTVNVSSTFAAGDNLVEAYSGKKVTVQADGTITMDIDPSGIMLLEKEADSSASAPFSWDNATVYFVITDRFENGETSNDNSYGRKRDGSDEVGTFHGGDLKGLTSKLDYIKDLGVNAIWITAPFEQIHGWVGGGNGGFKHYGYHGYYALDYTRLDNNMGSEQDLRDLIKSAHDRGIRVIFDVVMNHPGYATLEEMATYFPAVLKNNDWRTWEPTGNQNYHSYHELFIDYNHQDWRNWWGTEWIRAGLPGHIAPGSDDLTKSLASLPDFRTEDFRTVSLSPMLKNKADTRATEIPNYTVRNYLVKWLSDWVREYGVDGFRCDTTKHVEKESWKELKQASADALRQWKQNNPNAKLDDLGFWMTGEVFPHGVTRDGYFDNGFDSLINFDFQTAAKTVVNSGNELENIFSGYAGSINSDPTFNVLSYISSHDTSLFFDETGGSLPLQYRVATAMMLLPGGVQIYYGDETARPMGPSGGERVQGTRSDMNWNNYPQELLTHWQKMGQFRNRHLSIGAGQHARIPHDSAYVFSRNYSANGTDDKVVVVIAGLN